MIASPILIFFQQNFKPILNLLQFMISFIFIFQNSQICYQEIKGVYLIFFHFWISQNIDNTQRFPCFFIRLQSKYNLDGFRNSIFDQYLTQMRTRILLEFGTIINFFLFSVILQIFSQCVHKGFIDFTFEICFVAQFSMCISA